MTLDLLVVVLHHEEMHVFPSMANTPWPSTSRMSAK
jgi:hypothetical protein